jgi:hypothetical protein
MEITMLTKERLDYIREWQRKNKDKRRSAEKRYRERHRDRMKIKQFLYGHSSGRKGQTRFCWGLLNGDGCCLFCGKYFPFSLEQHHLFGPENRVQITLCANCHLIYHRTHLTLDDYMREIFI